MLKYTLDAVTKYNSVSEKNAEDITDEEWYHRR